MCTICWIIPKRCHLLFSFIRLLFISSLSNPPYSLSYRLISESSTRPRKAISGLILKSWIYLCSTSIFKLHLYPTKLVLFTVMLLFSFPTRVDSIFHKVKSFWGKNMPYRNSYIFPQKEKLRPKHCRDMQEKIVAVIFQSKPVPHTHTFFKNTYIFFIFS